MQKTWPISENEGECRRLEKLEPLLRIRFSSIHFMTEFKGPDVKLEMLEAYKSVEIS